MEGIYSLKPREYQTVAFTSGPINIADFKAALGLAYVVIVLVIQLNIIWDLCWLTWKSEYLTLLAGR